MVGTALGAKAVQALPAGEPRVPGFLVLDDPPAWNFQYVKTLHNVLQGEVLYVTPAEPGNRRRTDTGVVKPLPFVPATITITERDLGVACSPALAGQHLFVVPYRPLRPAPVDPMPKSVYFHDFHD
jgi:hypothetical protein